MQHYRAYFVGPQIHFIRYRLFLSGTGSSFAKMTAKLSKKPRRFSKAPQLSFGLVLGSSRGSSVKRSRAASVGGLFHSLPALAAVPRPSPRHHPDDER
jgi:hypothetical protein